MSGRYQSKVFNFLSRQSLRLQDRSAQAWRQTKTAAVWGVQILLYPVYVGFQTLRLTGKQLRQANRTLLRLRATKPSADAPIRRALKAISSLEIQTPNQQPLLIEPNAATRSDLERELALYTLSKDQPQLASPDSQTNPQTIVQAAQAVPDVATVRIQGIASMLESGSLVLVTSRNQILDVLTFEQQTQLSRRITLELANYWQQQRLRAPAAHLTGSRYLPLPKPQKHALLPIRVFRSVMTWMQRGSVAAAADLFQESQLGVDAPILMLPGSEMRSAQPAWITAEAEFYNWLEQTGRSVGTLLLDGLTVGQNLLTSLTTKGSLHLPQQPAQPSMEASHNLDTAAWLAALDRWLSRVPGLQAQLPSEAARLSLEEFSDALPEQLRHQQLRHLSASGLPFPAESQFLEQTGAAQAGYDSNLYLARSGFTSWLQQGLRKLSSGLARVNVTASNSRDWELVDTAVLEAALKNQPDRQPSMRRATSFVRLQHPSGQTLQSDHSAHWNADIAPSTMTWLDELEAPLSSLDTANQEEAAMLPPSWIETEAQLVGYVKHPLEQLLEWLDQSMVWVEMRLAKVWQWLTRSIS